MKFRIITDEHSGYEVQVWRRSAWHQISWLAAGKFGTNTNDSITRAEALIQRWSQPQPVPVSFQPEVVKEIEL